MNVLEEPILIEESSFADRRGNLIFNKLFDAALIRRIYFIENSSMEIIRAWQGEKVERRWFMAVAGSFFIKLIRIDYGNSLSNFLNNFLLLCQILDQLTCQSHIY